VEEGRSFLRVRTTAILLTIALAVFVLVSFALVIAGPELADKVADSVGLGSVFRWSWKILQWPVVLALMVTGIGMIYYFAPDVKQEWKWITPGAAFATVVWLIVSLAFRWYVSAFANYQKTYGAIGAAIVALLWFYVSGIAMLLGAEMNAVIEHASPEGKDEGEKVPGQKEREGVATTASGIGPITAALPAVRPSRPRGRFSEALIGTVAIVAELGTVAALVVRRVKSRIGA